MNAYTVCHLQMWWWIETSTWLDKPHIRMFFSEIYPMDFPDSKCCLNLIFHMNLNIKTIWAIFKEIQDFSYGLGSQCSAQAYRVNYCIIIPGGGKREAQNPKG